MWCLLSLLLLAQAADLGSQAQEVCGGRTSSRHFQLVSLAGRRCDVTVDAASTSVCGLSLDLSAPAPPCPSGSLTVAGRPLCGPIRGTLHLPFPYPQALLSYRGDLEGGPGFNMTVRQMECSDRQSFESCGGELTGENIVLQSPGYPSGYPGGLNCHYTLRPSHPGVCQLELRFRDSALEKSTNCSKDSLEINGDPMCGELLGVRTYDIQDRLDLRFTTDAEGSDKGFYLTARQIRCSDTSLIVPEGQQDNDKQDTVIDCPAQSPQIVQNPPIHQGYPSFQLPFPPFLLPSESFPARGYLPPDNLKDQQIPLEPEPPLLPPFRKFPQNNPSLNIQCDPVSSEVPSFQSKQNTPWRGYRPPEHTGAPSNRPFFFQPFIPNSPSNLPQRPIPPPLLPSFRPGTVYSQYRQCCSLTYSDSHFLIVSPGFPRSQSTDCIYTISRYSPLTYQIRLQFRYFWVGQDTGTGCSGGFLEIDGNRVCGCKTGVVWTSNFYDSEDSKTLHLRFDSAIGKVINGFVIEVYQDDSYSQRFRRSNLDSYNNSKAIGGRLSNFSQYVETTIDRYPLLVGVDSYQPLGNSADRRVWDPLRQTWSSPTDLLCLQWNFQDFLLLVEEILWARYQCPVSSVASGSARDTVLSQSAACQTCHYFCRQNCHCC